MSKKTDIVDLILKDHTPLKKFIQVLKDKDISIAKKKTNYEQFAPELLQHADPEEKSLYARMKEEKKDLRTEGFEGETEHAIASRLIDEINLTKDPDQWMARVKVLAELVEHHIEEEESDVLKDVKKQFDSETRSEIGESYLRLRKEAQASKAPTKKMKYDKSIGLNH